MKRLARRIAVGVLGGALVVVGLVMLVAPGPGLIVIPAGLAVLALEFEPARRIRDRLRAAIRRRRWRRG